MNEKNILYIGYYYKKDVIEQRNSSPYISQAGMNKMSFLRRVFEEAGYSAYILSYAWTNSRSFRGYKGFWSKEDDKLYYSGIFGAPVLNSFSCIWSGKRFVDNFMKEHTLDAVVFYNMRWETAALAKYIKRKYHVPIILEYEDGLSIDLNNSGLKRWFYGGQEKSTLRKLDGAILVNSVLRQQIGCPYMVSRGGTVPMEGQLPHPKKDEKKTFLFASTLDDQRGLPVLLEAMKYVKSDVRLLITGRGELEGTLTEIQDNRIEFLGYLSYEDYQEVLAEADVCICAQKSLAAFGQVSFPSKIFEYLSAHKLVITSDVADAKEYLAQVALVYTEDDPRKLAECMEQAISIYEDEQLRMDYSNRVERCIKENSIEETAKTFAGLMEEIQA